MTTTSPWTTTDPETVLPPAEEERSGLTGWWGRRSRRFRRLLAASVVLMIAFVVASGGLFYTLTTVPLPANVETSEVSTITYRDGTTEIAKIGSINRVNVPLSEVSLDAQHAVLAAENKNFYDEDGVSWRGIARAFWANVRGGEITQGGSTITQQYAKNAYLTQERTFSRKLREIAIAIKLDRKYSKEEILEFYLNTIYFGRGAYGIEAAAQAYFGVPAKDLTAEQGAVIAGLIRAPSALDPRVDPAGAETRFRQVLATMVEKGWLDATRADTSVLPATQPIVNTGVNQPKTPQDAYVREQVKRELVANGISEDVLTRGGLTIVTTLDPAAQQSAIDAVNAQLGFAPADVQPAVVAVEPGTGAVRAWYGGRFFGSGPDGYEDFVDNATYPVQPGSSFKPIVLAAALEEGISLNSFYPGNNGLAVPGGTIRNYGGSSYGSVNLLTATARSVNTAYVQLGLDVGLDKVADMARALGVPNGVQIDEVPAMALGVADVAPLDMANVYATFAAQGVRSDVHLVEKVVDRDGEVLYEATPGTFRALPPDVAADQTYALQQPLVRGTAAGLSPGRVAAGKTGTTDDNRSVWMCGYVPQLASCVAVFRDQNQSLAGLLGGRDVTGGGLAGPIWDRFMTGALVNTPVAEFPAPAHVGRSQSRVDAPAPRPTAEPSVTPSVTPSPSASPSARPTEASPSAAPATSAAPQVTQPPARDETDSRDEDDAESGGTGGGSGGAGGGSGSPSDGSSGGGAST